MFDIDDITTRHAEYLPGPVVLRARDALVKSRTESTDQLRAWPSEEYASRDIQLVQYGVENHIYT